MTIRRTLNHNVAKTAATFNHAKATARTLRQTHERHLAVRDLFQVPTAISMAGLAMVLKGSRTITTLGGVNRITAGRALDLVDGVVARTCNQESDAGALADTVCDKLGMLAITHSALRAEALPKALPLAIFANNAASAALTICMPAPWNAAHRMATTTAPSVPSALASPPLVLPSALPAISNTPGA